MPTEDELNAKSDKNKYGVEPSKLTKPEFSIEDEVKPETLPEGKLPRPVRKSSGRDKPKINLNAAKDFNEDLFASPAFSNNPDINKSDLGGQLITFMNKQSHKVSIGLKRMDKEGKLKFKC